MTSVRSNVTGIILAGGKSSRMGTDKGFVIWDGKPFIQHIIEALKLFVSEILIVSDYTQYDTLGYRRIKDVLPNEGPLSGLYSGLKQSKTEINLVLSCDVPFITEKLLSKLINTYEFENEAYVCVVDEKLMPLVALYQKRCKKVCLELLNKEERRMMTLLKSLNNVQYLKLDKEEAKEVRNINTPKDLKEIFEDKSH